MLTPPPSVQALEALSRQVVRVHISLSVFLYVSHASVYEFFCQIYIS